MFKYFLRGVLREFMLEVLPFYFGTVLKEWVENVNYYSSLEYWRRDESGGALCQEGWFEWTTMWRIRISSREYRPKIYNAWGNPRLYKHYWPTRHRLSNSTRKGWLIGKNTSRTFSRAHQVYSFLFRFHFDRISQKLKYT